MRTCEFHSLDNHHGRAPWQFNDFPFPPPPPPPLSPPSPPPRPPKHQSLRASGMATSYYTLWPYHGDGHGKAPLEYPCKGAEKGDHSLKDVLMDAAVKWEYPQPDDEKSGWELIVKTGEIHSTGGVAFGANDGANFRPRPHTHWLLTLSRGARDKRPKPALHGPLRVSTSGLSVEVTATCKLDVEIRVEVASVQEEHFVDVVNVLRYGSVVKFNLAKAGEYRCRLYIADSPFFRFTPDFEVIGVPNKRACNWDQGAVVL